jgi:hypothetical protein
MGVYKKKDTNECSLVFSGSDDNGDWYNNLWAPLTTGIFHSACGYRAHSGFVSEARGFLRRSGYRFLEGVIRSDCNGEVNVVGHSLGGAVATIIATCANHEKLSELAKDEDILGFEAKSLYTMGAPSVSETPMSAGGTNMCFEGLRVYNTFGVDPVPAAATYALGLKHPYVKSEDLNGEGEAHFIDCHPKTEDSAKANEKLRNGPYVSRKYSVENHGMRRYLQRETQHLIIAAHRLITEKGETRDEDEEEGFATIVTSNRGASADKQRDSKWFSNGMFEFW